MNRPRMALGLFVALALPLGACAGLGDPRTDDDRIDHPTGSRELILRVEVAGGFLPPDAWLRQLPQFSLFGDGRLITEGPQIEIYPPPALPSMVVRSVEEAGIQAILRAARDAGLFGADRHLDWPLIADAPTTTFTVVADGERHVISAYALGYEGDGDQAPISEEDRRARRRLAAFQEDLFALERWVPQGSIGADQQFEYDRMAVFAAPGAFRVEPDLGQEPKAWPLEQPLSSFGEPVATVGQGFRCGVIEGSDLEALLTRAREANQLTPWDSEGELFGLVFRPLLPDETGCPAL